MPKTEAIEPVSIKKIQELFAFKISESTAARRINLVRDALGKKKHQALTLSEFRNYFDI